MEEQAREQSGYLAFKSYAAEDGEVIALSEWVDEASARAWGRLPEHRAAQRRGREEYYESYTLFTCDTPRTHSFRHEDGAIVTALSALPRKPAA